MAKLIDLTGQKINRLTVIKRAENDKWGKIYWLCKCDCGNEIIVNSQNLRTGHTKSCGCLLNEIKGKTRKTHGLVNTRLYRIYTDMKTRCYNKNSNRYYRYGARNIKICDEWLSNFLSFYNWAISNGYKDGLSIDRINVNGNYEPINCRWITKNEQQYNTSRSHFINYKGEIKCLAEWCKILKLNYKKVHKRISKGLTFEQSII